jgi:hypothetical protein
MKVTQASILSSSLAAEAKKLGAALARLKIARGIKQDQAALRAGTDPQFAPERIIKCPCNRSNDLMRSGALMLIIRTIPTPQAACW